MAVRTRKKQGLVRHSDRRRRQARLLNVRLKRYRQARPKVYRRRIHPIKEYPRVDEFQRRFRLPPNMVKSLAAEFSQSRTCTTKGTTKGGGLTIEDRVCLALRYLATGANYSVIADTQGVSRSSVARAVDEFVLFLFVRRKDHIYFPKGLELHETAVRFARKFKFDGVVGCVDGTYIPIVRPTRNEHLYVCRHGYHALNCMVVTDDRQRFLHVDATQAGSHHDMHVWGSSDFGTKVTHTDRLGVFYLLGDGGYGASAHMLMPLKGQELLHMTPWERRYQTRQTTTRSSVERAIGQLKTRWRCLSRSGSGVIKKNPLAAGMLFQACCVLHNLCLDWGVGKLSPKEQWDPDLELEIALTAAERFCAAQDDVLPEHVESARKSASARLARNATYQGGMDRRAEVMFKYFGGPDPRGEEKRRARQYKRVSRAHALNKTC